MAVASNHSLITAGRVEGTPVFNQAGERIGEIEDLSIQKESGQVAYALLSFGGFLGLGERIHPLPWSVLKYDTEKDGYVVPLDRTQLESAPSYDKGELEAIGGDSDYRDRLFEYYAQFGASPYWL
ncbi:MAG: PRC-barrel domain-containing protein [Pseudomonadota bacterium]